MPEIAPPFEVFRDTDGTPLDGGSIYIGLVNQEPITNPTTAFWDAALTIPAAQPIRTIGGYPSRAGAPSKIYCATDFSITVKNKLGQIVLTALSGSSYDAGGVVYNDATVYPAGTVGKGLVDLSSAFDAAVVAIDARLDTQEARSVGYRNLLINANGLVNQRGYIDGTPTIAPNQYTFDRWRVVTSGQSVSAVIGSGISVFTAPAGGVEQVIEGNEIIGGSYALNWVGTATATVNGTARAKGETFSLTGGTSVTVRFSNGSFSKAQLEAGTISTPFEGRPLALEIALCQRYYIRESFNVARYAQSATALVFPVLALPVTMRATPACSFSGAPSYTGCNTGTITPTGGRCVRFGATATGAGEISMSGTYVADAEL